MLVCFLTLQRSFPGPSRPCRCTPCWWSRCRSCSGRSWVWKKNLVQVMLPPIIAIYLFKKHSHTVAVEAHGSFEKVTMLNMEKTGKERKILVINPFFPKSNWLDKFCYLAQKKVAPKLKKKMQARFSNRASKPLVFLTSLPRLPCGKAFR